MPPDAITTNDNPINPIAPIAPIRPVSPAPPQRRRPNPDAAPHRPHTEKASDRHRERRRTDRLHRRATRPAQNPLPARLRRGHKVYPPVPQSKRSDRLGFSPGFIGYIL